jgi:hypothetical protein
VSVFDAGDQHWRGAVVWAVAGSNITLRVLVESGYVRDTVVALSLFTAANAGSSVGAPIAARITGTPGLFTVHEVRGALPGVDESDEAGLVAQGRFYPAVLNGCVPGCHRYQDEG